jgi:pSer/pThr/pTyr-binding forkhead associated (FHA) protein
MQFWSGDHLAIEVSGPHGASEIVVPHPYALIGALAKADVRLTGEGVQKRAALLYAVEGRIMCRRLEGELAEPYCEVSPGDWVQLGVHRLRARIVPHGDGSLSLGEEKPRIPVLRVRHKARASVNRRLYRELETVGRAGDCELELRSSQVSLYHCVLLREGSRLWCIDLGSGNGTTLNGQAVQCAQLELGGRLRIGDFELEFQRYSRRSATALAASDSPAGSNLSLSPTPLLEERRLATIQEEDRDAEGESTFGSKIVLSAAPLHSSTSSLSGLAAFPAPITDDVLRLETQMAELTDQQAELLDRINSLTEENARLRSEQNSLMQQPGAQNSALREELQQQIQSEREALAREWTQRLDDARQSSAEQVAANIESRRHALSQELDTRLTEAHQSALQVLRTEVQELGLQLEKQSAAQHERLITQAEDQRKLLADELQRRIDELSGGRAEQLKLQFDAQRLSLLQELTKRLEAGIEGRLQPLAAGSESGQTGDSQFWSQRVEELRTRQAEEIALAVAAQSQALSDQLMQRCEELQRHLASDLGKQIEQQRQSSTQDLAQQLAVQNVQARELISNFIAEQREDLQKAWDQQLAAQADQLRRELVSELSSQIEAQQGSTAQDLLARLEEQRLTLHKELTAQAEAFKQQFQSLQTALEHVTAHCSQADTRLGAQAEQLQGARQALQDLQSRLRVISEDQTTAAEIDWHPSEATEASVALLDSGIHSIADRQLNEEFAEPGKSGLMAESKRDLTPLERSVAAPIDADDPLLHFVSDRLATLDSGNQRWMVAYWIGAVAAVVILGAGAWGLWYWLSSLSAT